MSLYPDIKAAPQNSNDSLYSSSQKKVLYFSDGTLDVDELDGNSNTEDLTSSSVPVNPQDLTWIPWMWYHTVSAGSKALEVCDYLGESLASFFGITTPKYQFEINEYNRLKKEEEAQNDIELGSWTKEASSDELSQETISTKPKSYSLVNDGNIPLS